MDVALGTMAVELGLLAVLMSWKLEERGGRVRLLLRVGAVVVFVLLGNLAVVRAFPLVLHERRLFQVEVVLALEGLDTAIIDLLLKFELLLIEYVRSVVAHVPIVNDRAKVVALDALSLTH
jgi:hypothetical protein